MLCGVWIIAPEENCLPSPQLGLRFGLELELGLGLKVIFLRGSCESCSAISLKKSFTVISNTSKV